VQFPRALLEESYAQHAGVHGKELVGARNAHVSSMWAVSIIDGVAL
jgi:hypothetical protein